MKTVNTKHNEQISSHIYLQFDTENNGDQHNYYVKVRSYSNNSYRRKTLQEDIVETSLLKSYCQQKIHNIKIWPNIHDGVGFRYSTMGQAFLNQNIHR